MSKRWIVAAVGVVLVAGAAAGTAVVMRGGSEPTPAALRISPGSGSAGGGAALASASAESADRMMVAPYFREEYVLGAELPALDDDAPAWVAAAIAPTAEDAARLAAAFGVTGEPVLQEWGAWTVGPQDGTGPSLTVTSSGLGDWWFSSPAQAVEVACAMPAQVEPTLVDPALVDPATTSNDPAVSGPAPDCLMPEPPTDLPSDDQALAEAARLVAAVGGPTDGLRVVRDDWGVNVERPLVLGGVEAPLWSTFRFTSGGQVEYANGILGSFAEAGAYPRIGTAAAFANLQAGRLFPWYAAAPAARTDLVGGDAAVSGPAEGGAAVDPAQGAPTPELTSVDPAVLPALDPAAEVRTVTITGVEPSLFLVPGADGGSVLVPAYRFLSADGGQYDVLAVPDDLVQVVAPPAEPLPEPAPLPVETVAPTPAPEETTTLPVDTAPPSTIGRPVAPGDTTGVGEPGLDTSLTALVGLTEADALAKAEAEGRMVRVISRDGVELPVTAEYVAERVNLEVVAGVVTAVRLG